MNDEGHTDGHCDLETLSAQWANSVIMSKQNKVFKMNVVTKIILIILIVRLIDPQ